MLAKLCVVLLAGVLLNAQAPERTAANSYSQEKEAALGAGLAADMRQHTSALTDSAVHDYVDAVGRRLAAQIRSGFEWEVTVIRDDVGGSTHEPLSIPGRHVFVPASLVLAAENETEFAGMLAHAMAHIAERHGIRTATQTDSRSRIPLVFVGTWMRMGADDRVSLPARFISTQRGDELEADRVAVRVMAAADYDAGELLKYIRRTQSSTYSVLPPRDERIGALQSAIANAPTPADRTIGEFAAIQDRVRKLVTAPQSPPKQPPSLRRKNER